MRNAIFFFADAANLITNVYPFPTRYPGVDFVDIDGDGDLDFYFGGGLTSMRLFQNIGTKKHPFLRPDTLNAPPTGFESLPPYFQLFQFVDLDGDGDYDCFLSDFPGAPGYITKNEDRKAIASFPQSEKNVAAYPNPFTAEFTLSLSYKTGLKNTIRISDLAGRILFTQTTADPVLKAGSTLPKGMYMLQVWQDKTLVYHTGLMKQ